MIEIEWFKNFVRDSLNSSQSDFEKATPNLGRLRAILEYKTIGMNTARRVGKTRTLIQYSSGQSSLFYDGTRKSFINPMTHSNITENCFCGSRFFGMKYSCFVVDEATDKCFNERIIPMLQFLIMSNLIATDFHIVYLGTRAY